MTDSVSLTVELPKNNIFDGMASRAKDPTAYLKRVVLEDYRAAQIERWDTENASQGQKWKDLEPGYAAYKLKKYSTYPYGGKKMLVGTGDLLKSVVGPGDGFNNLVSGKTFIVKTSVDYAPEVAITRPFMTFSKRTLDEWRAKYVEWLTGGA